MNEPILCFVTGCWAYFTTQPLEEQWGNDWNDAPYEHNCGLPYTFDDFDRKSGKAPWQIVKCAFDADLEQPHEWHFNSPYSVEMINRKVVPWLQSGKYGLARDQKTGEPILIWAGTPFSEAIRLIHRAGGEVYLSEAATRREAVKV